jgi:hypothetical protein
VKTHLFIARQFFQIGFNFTDLMSDDAFQMTQIVKDLTFEVDFGTIALADLIQLIDNVAQIRANFLNLFIPWPTPSATTVLRWRGYLNLTLLAKNSPLSF